MADGRWQMADGRWQMAESNRRQSPAIEGTLRLYANQALLRRIFSNKANIFKNKVDGCPSLRSYPTCWICTCFLADLLELRLAHRKKVSITI